MRVRSRRREEGDALASSTSSDAEITRIFLLPVGWRRERASSALHLLEDAQASPPSLRLEFARSRSPQNATNF